MLRAELIGPLEAEALGALDEVVPHDQVVVRALAVAEELAALPRSAYGQIKHQLRRKAIDVLAGIDQDPLLDSWIAPEAGKAAAGILGSPDT